MRKISHLRHAYSYASDPERQRAGGKAFHHEKGRPLPLVYLSDFHAHFWTHFAFSPQSIENNEIAPKLRPVLCFRCHWPRLSQLLQQLWFVQCLPLSYDKVSPVLLWEW